MTASILLQWENKQQEKSREVVCFQENLNLKPHKTTFYLWQLQAVIFIKVLINNLVPNNNKEGWIKQ